MCDKWPILKAGKLSRAWGCSFYPVDASRPAVATEEHKAAQRRRRKILSLPLVSVSITPLLLPTHTLSFQTISSHHPSFGCVFNGLSRRWPEGAHHYGNHSSRWTGPKVVKSEEPKPLRPGAASFALREERTSSSRI